MDRPLELSRPLRPAGLLLAFGLVLALPRLARGAEIQMNVSPIGCWAVVSGVAGCAAAPDALVDITFALDAPQTLNGYDLEIRWNVGELTLISATQLHPDTGTPAAFLEQPSDPADSRAAVFEFSAAATTQLFRLRFQTGGALVLDGQADLSWFPNSNGLAPASVVLENSAGAAIDFGPPPAEVPALNLAGRALLVLLLGLFALRDRLPPPSWRCPRCAARSTGWWWSGFSTQGSGPSSRVRFGEPAEARPGRLRGHDFSCVPTGACIGDSKPRLTSSRVPVRRACWG